MGRQFHIVDNDFNLIDFSKDATSQEIRDTIGQETGATVLSRLKDLWDKLHDLFVNGIAKIKIWDGINTAGITTDGKLKVDAEFSGTVGINQYSPRFYHSHIDIELSQSSDTELANINLPSGISSGKIDAISVNFNRDDVEFVLEIDGVEILRIELDDLAKVNKYNLESDEFEGDDDD